MCAAKGCLGSTHGDLDDNICDTGGAHPVTQDLGWFKLVFYAEFIFCYLGLAGLV